MANLYRVAVAAHDPEQTYITTMYFVDGGTGDVNDLAAHFVGAITTALKTTLVTTGQLDSATVVHVPAAFGTGGDEATVSIGIAGTYNPGGGPNLPRELVGLVRLKTNFASRHAKGWRYGYPIQQPGSLDAHGLNLVTGSNYQIALATWATAFTDTVVSTGETYAPVVYSRTAHKQGLANYWFGVTAAVPQLRVHTLRKRNDLA